LSGQLHAPAAFTAGKESRYPFSSRWASEPALKILKREKCLAPTKIRTPDRPAYNLIITPGTLSMLLTCAVLHRNFPV